MGQPKPAPSEHTFVCFANKLNQNKNKSNWI